MVSHELISGILKQYRLELRGIHGLAHWGRVLENGLRLAQITGAKSHVTELFAVFHDACRINEDYDPQPGSRGADLATALRGKCFELSDADFLLLKVACRLHTDGMTDGDITVRTCLDADRLDLGRMGVKPHPAKLCTEAARNPSMLEWANDRTAGGYVPVFVNQSWQNLAVNFT